MLYSEFVEGTGCKDNEHNYNLYKELELIYMNSDCTKAHIYEMGKKLADNSKSEAELKFEADINAEMAEIKEQMESNKHWIAYYKEQKNYSKSVGDKYWEKRVQKNRTVLHRGKQKAEKPDGDTEVVTGCIILTVSGLLAYNWRARWIKLLNKIFQNMLTFIWYACILQSSREGREKHKSNLVSKNGGKNNDEP